MKKFHFNPETGETGSCSAKKGNCPFLAEDEHFNSESEARKGFEHSMKEFSFVKNKKDYIASTLQKLTPIDYSNLEAPWVEDNWGDGQELKYGVLDDEAKRVLMNGQCLGFAKVLAEKFGTNKIAVHHHTVESEDFEWDEEADDFKLDENGEEIPITYESIHHAYAIAPDGTYWDGLGKAPLNTIELMPEGKITEYSSDDAYMLYSGYMVEQEENWSESLVEKVLLSEKNKTSHNTPVPQRFYHITSKKKFNEITKSGGLEPTIGENSEALGESEPKIYLFDSKEAADNALGGWLGELYDEDEELTLLSVESRVIGSPQPTFDDPEGSWEWTTSEKIPFNFLKEERAFL